MPRRHPIRAAFTLVELMIVIAIIGVLASVAIPAFMKYIRKARTTEGVQNVRKLYESGKAYLLEESQGRGSIVALDKQFPDSEPLTPAATCCGEPSDKCTPVPSDWDTPTWNSLRFAMDDPHWYRYEFVSTGTAGAGVNSRFTARALGDLDCDTIEATFEMIGVWSDISRDVLGSASFFRYREIE